MPQEDEVEIIIHPDGRLTISACTACALGAKDDRCSPSTTDLVQAIVREGRVTEVREPKEEPHVPLQ